MWNRHSRSSPPTGTQGNVALSHRLNDHHISRTRNGTSHVMRYLATVACRVTDPKLLNLPDSLAPPLMPRVRKSLCYRTYPARSDVIILWHRRCNPVPPAACSAPARWRMALHTTVEDQVIDVLHRTQMCDLEEVTRQCINLTWNQVFLAVDRLSRSGKILLKTGKRGTYAVTLPHRQEGLFDRRSVRS